MGAPCGPSKPTEVELPEQIQPVRGMNDVLPAQIGAWQHLEASASELLTEYGYEEIRAPVVEHTELFKRAIGEFTDVVEKEMYTFTDQGGESLTLRPEATAGIMRAAITNGMLRGQRSEERRVGKEWRSRWGPYQETQKVNADTWE